MAGKAKYRTQAQESLLNCLKASPGKHYTAAELRDYFAAQDRPIGTATIYRRLERFVEEGSIQKYTLGPGDSACYAYVENQQCAAHSHCKCEVCGRLIHLNCDELLEIQTYLQERHNFTLNAGKTVFYGICGQCRKT